MTTRRSLLKAGTAGAAGLAFGPAIVSGRAQGGGARRVGLIGSGWYGKSSLFRLIQVEPVEVAAICDVDEQMRGHAAGMVRERQASGKTPKTYGDYRKMLEQEKLDIVLVATPDHWHALPMIAACEAGCDVYVEKPTSVDVVESLAMLAAARKHGRQVQVNLQRRSTPHLVEARDQIIGSGRLGKVSHVEIGCYYHMRAKGKTTEMAPPPHLDWEMWTGPAPMRPYNDWVHPRRWRAFKEYGNGIVGDMCVHMLDMVRWMLDLGWPERVYSSGGIFVQKDSSANITDTQTATFSYPGLDVVWNHRSWGNPPDPEYPWAGIIYGENGTLKVSVHRWDFIPRGKREPEASGKVKLELEEYPEDKTEERLEKHVAPALRAHLRDFLASVDDRSRLPVSSIEQGVITSVACQLANLSLDLGRSLTWDPAASQVVGDDEANAGLARPYRGPWEHPDPHEI